MVFKIADIYIEIESSRRLVYDYCRDYFCKEYPRIDFKVCVTEEEVFAELPNGISRENASERALLASELSAIYRKICEKMLEYDAFLMHGALIEYEGRGYLFAAKSGMGKTTHISLWKKVFGEDKVTIVNGDKPILRLVDGKIYAYGTPWCGKEGFNVNTKVNLSAICFIERAADNSIVRISDVEALPRLLAQIMLTDSGNLPKQLELIDSLFEDTPTYLLKCNMEDEAARVSYNGMQKSAH